ncbi:MAG: CHAT domain-containing protein, partial [Myxococcales bacterium]|nr:CHAT domain-containing protein [Myxococcales bacterium]
MLLHVRDMEHYSPMMKGLLDGYRRLTGLPTRLSDGYAYLHYTDTVASIRDRFDVPPHAIDLVLSEVARAPERLGGEVPRSGKASSKAGVTASESSEQSDDASAAPESSPEEAVELHLDLRLHLPRRCVVRLHDDPESPWPEQGKRLPDPVLLRAIREGDVSDDRALGRQYFEALFADDALRRRYEAARAQAQDSGACFRLVLHLHGDTNGEGCTIAAHLWETLLDPNRGRLATDHGVRLLRVVPRIGTGEAPTPGAELRALIGFAKPVDAAPLDFYREWSGFNGLLRSLQGDQALRFDFHERLDLDALREALGSIALLHFAGHGEAGGLILEGPDRRSQRLSAEALRGLLVAPLPRLVVLNACHGGSSDDSWL